ncbi:MAG: hypothetical protein KBG48_08690 [Kofleriaceae bacterium]|jgi:hypothetical protein|nr:hypothetical protein [Kofleriaceae bacterium]MBP9167450.1 hypothetical protein [Kofleriaceae bacterium]MBP9862625.1 hypothetical protein [Kofleriaceae bacterium]
MRSLLALALALAPAALAACGGAEASSPQPTSTPAAAEGDAEAVAACETFMARARDCTDDYIPALVDLRIELDLPTGIADFARTEGRDAVIAKAMEEWATDSQPAALAATCQKVTTSLTAEQREGQRAGATACLAQTACDAYASCAIELMRPHMTAAKAGQ